MTFSDIANFVLARLRQRGIAWGASPTNQNADLMPPYEVALAVNTAYNSFLRDTLDARIAALDVDCLTVANASSYALNPLPVGVTSTFFGGVNRPAIMQVYEFRYTYGNAASLTNPLSQSRYIPSLSTVQFRGFSGAYTQRYGAYAAFPRRVVQQYGRRQVDLFPGTATAGDTIQLFACPDPQATGAYYLLNPPFNAAAIPAAAGGLLTAAGDVPIVPAEFHMALVYLATAILAEQADKLQAATFNRTLYQQIVDSALEFGAVTMEGDSEQRVVDPYLTAFDLDAAVL